MTKKIQKHPFHLVDNSPWPFFSGISVLTTTFGFVLYLHNFNYGFNVFIFGFLFLIYIVFSWWRDIIRESTFQGHHTEAVQNGLRYGMLLFIISEIMFFFAFFWGFFSASLSPTLEIGTFWPPVCIELLNPWEVPLLNTLLLLLSGASCTWSHSDLIRGKRLNALISLFLTIFLGIFFTFLQIVEYITSNFSINDSIYGSIFFLSTGFHGFHVFIGTTFLIVCLIRLFNYHFTKKHHFGFEAACWYWHFVDVVWLFLFVSIYC